MSSSNVKTTITPIRLPDVKKGKSDWREYRALKLPNGVICVLVNDKESKYTAMATTVDAGASYDPRDLSGLAHFTEHMCFLGSAKYPGENEYKRYLSSHGGHSNASTAMGYTTYKFDVLAEHAEKAIDIFSNFFVSPLFTQSGTNREVNAVDSENSKNLISDARRRLQIIKALADPYHHYSKFSTGNALTLPAAVSEEDYDEPKFKEAARVREALLNFHKRHYRPKNMFVVCIGPQSLDTLEEWVVPRYAGIEDRWLEKENGSDDMTEMERLIDDAAKDAPSNRFGVPEPPHNPAYKPELQNNKWPVLLTTLPLKSMRKVILYFPVPPVRYRPDNSPTKILSHLLGHEGPGSTFALLQDAGLLSSLSAGPRISASDQCLLQIDISLTEEGETRWKEVAQCLFQHCGLIYHTALAAQKEHSNNSDRIEDKEKEAPSPNLNYLHKMWNEIITLENMQFHQTSPGSAYNLAPNLAASILMNGTEDCMSAGYMLNESEETLPLDDLVTFASLMNPSNCIVERCSQLAWDEAKTIDYGNNPMFGFKKEKWYDVEYCLSTIDEKDVSMWSSSVHESYVNGGTNDIFSGNESKFGHLHLPKENLFIPKNLYLCSDLPIEAHTPRIEKELDPPNLIIEDNRFGRLWHRLDDRYALPKASLTFFMRNACVEHTKDDKGKWYYDSEASIRSMLLMSVFSDALAQETYDASLAGLNWSFSKSSSGITLACGGYSERIPELALKLLRDFFYPGQQATVGGLEDFSFLKEKFFDAAKDRTVRNLKSYFQSKRADSHAMYYTNLLISNRGTGVKELLTIAESITFESLVEHHKKIIQNKDSKFECLYSGNVSKLEAKNFFNTARVILEKRPKKTKKERRAALRPFSTRRPWVPGPHERRLNPGESIELHFQSENQEEENGAVLVTFQSPIPGYKGSLLSDYESLRSSAAIRLIAHMLREPLFDELRTKQQLGYIVQSYYDLSFSIKTQDEYPPQGKADLMVPIDAIGINVLSRKCSPPEVTSRIDEFLGVFRKSLENIPESEILDHSDALREQLLKPIQKLGTEVSLHFGKILLFGPEVLDYSDRRHSLPWNKSKDLAQVLKTVTREDLLEVWDQVVGGRYRSRVVSHVYGKTFPLKNEKSSLQAKGRSHILIVDNLNEIFEKRKELAHYNSNLPKKSFPLLNSMLDTISNASTNKKVAAALIGVGVIGLGLHALKKREDNRTSEGNIFGKVLNLAKGSKSK